MSAILYLLKEIIGSLRSKHLLLCLALSGTILVFLAVSALLFLFTEPVEDDLRLKSQEIIAYLPLTLPTATIRELLFEIRAHPKVVRVAFRFSEEFHREDPLPGRYGLLFITAYDIAAAQVLAAELAGRDDIMEVIFYGELLKPVAISLTPTMMIGFVAGILIAIAGVLLLSRYLFTRLLAGLTEHLRLLHTAAIPERTIQTPFIILGAICGLIGGLLFAGIIYLLHRWAVGDPGTIIRIAAGMIEPMRILSISISGVVVSILLGGAIGGLGASLTTQPRFYH
ncbi:hypothetical protein LM597_02415 [Candidatus Acetothermia bacterium]|nr:hypothetical protein [Candidatus Acetothermia bacterium]